MISQTSFVTLGALLLCGGAVSAHEAQSAHYSVVSDTSQREAKLIAEHMEQAFTAYGRFLGPLELKGERLGVRIFASQAAFTAEGAKQGFKGDNFQYLHSMGDYERVVVGWSIPEPALLMRIRHEAFHQYFRRLVNYPPHWLNEGLAEVFEASLIDSSGGVSLRISAPMHRRLREGILKVDRGALNKKGYRRIEIATLVAMTKPQWKAKLNSAYSQSWAFAHFLLQGDEGAHVKTLGAVLAALSPDADEATNLAAAQEALGDIPGLARAYESWAKRTQVPGSESYARGSAAFSKQDYKAAERELTKALEADPLNPRYNYLRAQARYSLSKLDLARADIENAIAYAPEEGNYYSSLGKISTYRKVWPEAKWAFEKAESLGKGKGAAKYLAKIPGGTRARAPELRGTATATGVAAPSFAGGPKQPARPKPKPTRPKPQPRPRATPRPAPAQPKTPKAEGFTVGQAVAAKWRSGKWYSAAITGPGGKPGTFQILYDDGSKDQSLPPSRLRHLAQPGEVAVGDAVLAVWKTAQMWAGKVEDVNEQGAVVRWDDGSKPKRVPWGKFFKP